MDKNCLQSNSVLPHWVKRIVVITCSMFSFLCMHGQTPVSGVLNTYHQVVEVIPAKACLRITNVGALDVNSLVMVVQMKGASINTTASSSSFGDTTSLNEAGNYEIGTVCYIIGDSVFLFHNLLNNYNTTSGKVQLVQFAEYYSAEVIDTVKATSWDNTTGTGGVIAIFCDQDLTLQKPIYADSGGYDGGSFVLSSGTCSDGLPANNYAYNGSITLPQSGAYKGEGVAAVTSGQSGGRGAPANGGGGGNNHNNSGGGGANLNTGGIGGGNSSSGVSCTVSRRGEAGKAMSSWNGQKIFMGGGGGAGHSNNGLTTVSGGNGGGIIFIWASNVIGNNNLITANGGNGGSSVSDGAGGGGAGGTIIMHVSNYFGTVSIKAEGGNGGGSDNGLNLNRCFGGGGGGSGGVIYFTGPVPAVTTSVSGGAAGVEINREASCNPTPQTAGSGSNGQIFSSYTFARSTSTAGYCRILLPSKLLYFRAVLIEKKVRLSWEILNPELVNNFTIERKNNNNQWLAVSDISGNDSQQQYAIIDNNPTAGYNQYRLRINEKNNSVVYSAIQQVYADLTKNTFTVYPNPAIDKISVLGNFKNPSVLFLFDINGKLVLQKQLISNFTSITLPYLSPGIYMLRVNETVQKLIIL